VSTTSACRSRARTGLDHGPGFELGEKSVKFVCSVAIALPSVPVPVPSGQCGSMRSCRMPSLRLRSLADAASAGCPDGCPDPRHAAARRRQRPHGSPCRGSARRRRECHRSGPTLLAPAAIRPARFDALPHSSLECLAKLLSKHTPRIIMYPHGGQMSLPGAELLGRRAVQAVVAARDGCIGGTRGALPTSLLAGVP